MGSSQEAGWCKKLTSPTNARANLKVIRKTVYTAVLLTITVVTGATGNNEVLVTVGNSSVLTCSPKTNITMVTWKINPKAGGSCTLGYRADLNKTDRTNCSDNMNWKFRPDRDPALEIRQVGRAHEGIYTCEVAAKEGNFGKTHHLTVQVPPRLTLYCAGHGSPVCEAVAGKPPAQISWVPQNNSTSREEGHVDGTVTVVSMFTASSTNMTYTTCIVSHPAGNQSKSIACGPSREVINVVDFLSVNKAEWKGRIIQKFMMHKDVNENFTWFTHCVISVASLLGLLFLFAVLHLYIFCHSRYVWDRIHTTPFAQSWRSLEGLLVNEKPGQAKLHSITPYAIASYH
ncbi:cell surface glycoprotein CD200 receptor 1-B-like [Colius striatus]|uniref:cell surface glycoprotein CD200 receptor 1-B-like n=1 Tax=Colius striatus TaxID=57412 RepID=UPI002B1E5A92|nr:cell surface glycoprotein CD200 receptor 1-B-like [Colius striatus]